MTPADLSASQPASPEPAPAEPARSDAADRDGLGDRGLGRRASRGAATMMAGQGARLVVQTGGLILLARLLTPTDFGLATMVTAIIGIGETLRDFGLSIAALQARHISREERDNLFWVNTGIGALLTVVVIAAAPGIAALYGDDRLREVTLVLAVTFLLNGMTAQYRAGLQRELRVFMVNVSDVAGLAAGLVAGILIAVAGGGYWAIVWQQVVTSVVTLVIAVVAAGWLPRWYHRDTSIKPYLSFGMNVLAAQIIGYIAKNADSVTIGIRFGATPLGLYNRAFRFLALPLNQLNAPSTRVATPVLTRLRDQPKRYADYLLTGQTVLLHSVLAVVVSMAALAEPGIRLIVGAQWVQSVPLFQILALAGAFQTSGYVTYWVFLSKGLAKTSLRQSLISRPVAVATVVIGSFWGIEGVAWGYTAGALFNWPFSLWWISRVTDAPVRRLWWNGVRCLFGYAVAGVAGWAVSELLQGRPDILRIAAGLVAIVAVIVLQALVWPSFRRDLGLIRAAGKLLR
ncbi:lipopolysaccharide biosynthesis protein [Jatrophihabitans sp. YIM 134969]